MLSTLYHLKLVVGWLWLCKVNVVEGDDWLVKMSRELDVKKKSKFSIAPTDSTILVEFWIVDNISTVHGV